MNLMLKHLFILTVLLIGPLRAQTSLAIMDFSGESINSENLQNLNNILRSELLNIDTLNILDREEMIMKLEGQNLALNCNNHDCAVVAGLLLQVSMVITLDITRVGEVYVVSGLLYNAETGRVLNRITYDHEYTLEGLENRGMKNAAIMLMTNRIPMVVHKSENQIYIQSIPEGARLKIGEKIYPGHTPLAIDRVTIESKRITLIKENYNDYVITGLPEDESRVILARMSLLDPAMLQGTVKFKRPLPEGISIISVSQEFSILIPENARGMSSIPKGKYRLRSNDYIIKNGAFKILPLKTTALNPQFIKRSKLEKQLKKHRFRRTFFFSAAFALMGYAAYLHLDADKKYDNYSQDIINPDAIRNQVKNMDKLKPLMLGSGISLIIPAIYQQYNVFQIKKILED